MFVHLSCVLSLCHGLSSSVRTWCDWAGSPEKKNYGQVPSVTFQEAFQMPPVEVILRVIVCRFCLLALHFSDPRRTHLRVCGSTRPLSLAVFKKSAYVSVLDKKTLKNPKTVFLKANTYKVRVQLHVSE